MDGGLYIGVDLGTTSVKVGIFDDSGSAVAFASREFELDTPEPGFAEFDAEAYAGCAFDGIREVLAAPDADPASVRAIGLSSQAQTFVLVGERGRPVRPAVGWLDVRAGDVFRQVPALTDCPAANDAHSQFSLSHFRLTFPELPRSLTMSPGPPTVPSCAQAGGARHFLTPLLYGYVN